MPPDPYIDMWEFVVPPEQTAAFIAAYGPAGAWATLFRKAAGYRGTELYRDRNVAGRFVTIDFWIGPEAYADFRASFASEYEALDRTCESLGATEQSIGTFALADRSQPSL
jgi:heme-degrading monooxygenase HmoA